LHRAKVESHFLDKACLSVFLSSTLDSFQLFYASAVEIGKQSSRRPISLHASSQLQSGAFPRLPSFALVCPRLPSFVNAVIFQHGEPDLFRDLQNRYDRQTQNLGYGIPHGIANF